MSNDPKFVSIDLSKLEAPKYAKSCLLCDKDIPVNFPDSSPVICKECKELWMCLRNPQDMLQNSPEVVDASKYRKAVLVLQAIAQHAGSRKTSYGEEYTDEWTEAKAYRDCSEAAYRCLKSLNEPVMMPNKIHK